MLPDQLQQSRVDGRPDAAGAGVCSPAEGGGRSARELLTVAQVRHVVDRHLDGHLERLAAACVHDRDLAVGPAQEPRHLVQRPDGGREADPLRVDGGPGGKPLQAQGQVGAALVWRQRVDLVDDDPADAAQHRAGRAGEQKEERLWRGDEDVGRAPVELAALVGRGVAGPDADRDLGNRQAQALGLQRKPGQRRPQVALDVHGERLERAHVEDATAGVDGWDRLARQAVEAPVEGGQRLAGAGRGRHQRVAPGGDLEPAFLLDVGGLTEGLPEPVAGGVAEEVESGHQWTATTGRATARRGASPAAQTADAKEGWRA